mgnify:CR=1 FL=1
MGPNHTLVALNTYTVSSSMRVHPGEGSHTAATVGMMLGWASLCSQHVHFQDRPRQQNTGMGVLQPKQEAGKLAFPTGPTGSLLQIGWSLLPDICL